MARTFTIREDGRRAGAAAVNESVVKMFWKVMSLELKQLSRVTSATSLGSANSMSTHYRTVSDLRSRRARRPYVV